MKSIRTYIALDIFYLLFILFELVMNITAVAYPYLILMDISAIVVSAFYCLTCMEVDLKSKH